MSRQRAQVGHVHLPVEVRVAEVSEFHEDRRRIDALTRERSQSQRGGFGVTDAVRRVGQRAGNAEAVPGPAVAGADDGGSDRTDRRGAGVIDNDGVLPHVDQRVGRVDLERLGNEHFAASGLEHDFARVHVQAGRQVAAGFEARGGGGVRQEQVGDVGRIPQDDGSPDEINIARDVDAAQHQSSRSALVDVPLSEIGDFKIVGGRPVGNVHHGSVAEADKVACNPRCLRGRIDDNTGENLNRSRACNLGAGQTERPAEPRRTIAGCDAAAVEGGGRGDVQVAVADGNRAPIDRQVIDELITAVEGEQARAVDYDVRRARNVTGERIADHDDIAACAVADRQVGWNRHTVVDVLEEQPAAVDDGGSDVGVGHGPAEHQCPGAEFDQCSKARDVSKD